MDEEAAKNLQKIRLVGAGGRRRGWRRVVGSPKPRRIV